MYVRNHVRSICTCLNSVLSDHLALLFVNQGKMIGWVWNGYNTEARKCCPPTLTVLNPIEAEKATAGTDISNLVLKANLSYIKVCRQQDSSPNNWLTMYCFDHLFISHTSWPSR